MSPFPSIDPSPTSPLNPSTNQGSEEGWSDHRRAAEEDREQPQSPGFPRQERTGTCLKKDTPTGEENGTKQTESSLRLSVCLSGVVANHILTRRHRVQNCSTAGEGGGGAVLKN